jgi:hypothetical protein
MTRLSTKAKQAICNDNQTHSFKKEFKSQEIIDAARFRHALVSDEWEEDGIESFYYAFYHTGFWAKEYMKQSKIIFDYLVQKDKDVFGKCEATHNIDAARQSKTNRQVLHCAKQPTMKFL